MVSKPGIYGLILSSFFSDTGQDEHCDILELKYGEYISCTTIGIVPFVAKLLNRQNKWTSDVIEKADQ